MTRTMRNAWLVTIAMAFAGPTLVAWCVVDAYQAAHHDYLAPGPTSQPIEATSTTVSTPSSTSTTVQLSPWPALADCESGAWDAHGHPIAGSRHWDDRRGGYEGGLHFTAGTWDAYKPAGWPENADEATPQQQIAVAVRVRDGVRSAHLSAQGWRAWPVCSRKVGVR